MYRCVVSTLSAVVTATLIAPAAAQPQRAFPQDTLRGAMVFEAYPQVRLNGREMLLSPGSRVRSQDNLIVMAASLTGTRQLVHYTLDMAGQQVQDVWILRPEEAAVRPWPATLEQAHTWTFDATTQTWTKP